MMSDRRRIWVLAGVVMLLTMIPYLLGYASQGADWQFTGYLIGVEDGNSYIAKMRRGAVGDWLFRTPYSAQHQEGVFLYSYVLVLGKLTAPPAQHEQMVAVFHLFRVFAGMLMIVATWDFLGLFVTDSALRRWGTLFGTLGGGLGWLLAVTGWLGDLPLDFYSPEAFGFLALFTLPHIALARALMLWGLLVWLRDADKAWLAGLLWVGAALFQPLTIVTGSVMVAGFVAWLGIWAWRLGTWSTWWGWVRRAVVLGAISSPLVLWTVWKLSTDSLLRQWAAQNALASPPVWHYLAAYALVLPFAWRGFRSLFRRTEPDDTQWLPLVWVLLFLPLVYAPVSIQRRLLEGVWVMWTVLALWGLRGLASSWRRGLLAVSLLSTLFLFAGSLLTASQPSFPTFRPRTQVESFTWLEKNALPDSVVLTSFPTGNALPAFAPVYVVMGHGPETFGLAEIRPDVEKFYSGKLTSDEQIALLIHWGVDYVVWGDAEREFGTFSAVDHPYLLPVATDVYRVTLGD